MAEVPSHKTGSRVARGSPVEHSSMRRSRVIAALILAAASLALRGVFPTRLLFVWNASSSSPRGLYRVWPGSRPRRGEMALAALPAKFAGLADDRHYLPKGIPLVKRAAAVGHDRVCASGVFIRINGQLAARRKALDGRGRFLPQWSGCHFLKPGQYFLLGESPSSFDGRYFGLSESSEMIGRAVLLWRA